MEVETSSERGVSSSAAAPPQLPPPGPPAKKKRALPGMPGDYFNLRSIDQDRAGRLVYRVKCWFVGTDRSIDGEMMSPLLMRAQIPTRR
jgi:hypothetical protein